MRMKNREVDLLIVVNMFLTGFDAKTLNTLWVDKNLRMHGLLQAFSRTNRKLNSVKTFGNIVCFRNLEENTNESLALFGDEKAGGIVVLRNFEDYYNGFDDENGKHHLGYSEMVDELLREFPVGQPIILEEKQKLFDQSRRG
jgi:type I restriction enzyme R subunit